MKHTIIAPWLANPSHPCNDLPRNFWSSCEYLIDHSKGILMCSLSGPIGPLPPPPTTMLTIESRMVSKFWTCSSISFKNIFLFFSFCQILDPHLTTYNSNIGVMNIIVCVWLWRDELVSSVVSAYFIVFGVCKRTNTWLYHSSMKCILFLELRSQCCTCGEREREREFCVLCCSCYTFAMNFFSFVSKP